MEKKPVYEKQFTHLEPVQDKHIGCGGGLFLILVIVLTIFNTQFYWWG